MTRRRRHEMEDDEDDRNMVSYHRHHPSPSPAQHPVNFDDTEFVDGRTEHEHEHEHGLDHSPRERDYEHEQSHEQHPHDSNQHEDQHEHELPEQEQSPEQEDEDEDAADEDFEEEEEQAEEGEDGEDDGTVDANTDPSSNVDFLKATPTIQFDDDDDNASENNNKESPSMREIGHEAVWSLSTAKPGNGVDQIRDASPDTYWQSDGGQPHLINIQFSRRASVGMVAFYLDYNLDESYTPKRLSVRVGMTCHDLVEVRVVEMSEPIGWVCVRLNALVDVDDGWMMEEEEEEEPEAETSTDDAAANPDTTTASTRPSTNAPSSSNNNNNNTPNPPPNAHNTNTPNPPPNATTTTTSSMAQKMAKERNKRIRDEWKKRRQALPVRAHFIQICVVSMHQNGRDTHIRQVKIFGPKNIRNNRVLSTRMPCFAPVEGNPPDSGLDTDAPNRDTKEVPLELPLRRPMELLLMQEFTTVQMTQFDSIR